MTHYSFVRLSDGETIPLVAANDTQAIALLSQRENKKLSISEQGSLEYEFAKSDMHMFWCRPSTPVYHLGH